MQLNPLLAAAMLIAGAAISVEAKADPGDAVAGKASFHLCAACHSVTEGKTQVGPSLYGVVGRKAGSLTGYHYSAALVTYGKVWDESTLDTYLESPMKVVPGTKMSFVGVKDPTVRGNIIAYLTTLK